MQLHSCYHSQLMTVLTLLVASSTTLSSTHDCSFKDTVLSETYCSMSRSPLPQTTATPAPLVGWLLATAGDLYTLGRAIEDGDDVNAVIDLPNQHQHTVYGVTPLYLAAQAGNKEACEMLVAAGADVLRQCSIPESGDVFGPADIALIHFNLKTWFYLAGEKKRRLSKMSSRQHFKGSQIAQPLMEQAQLVI